MSEQSDSDASVDSNDCQEEKSPFTTQGKYKDEVALIFDDETKLYVPVSFLTLSSPVFVAMFSSDLKEKQDMEVKLPGKIQEDFLEFLLCIHPRVLQPIQDENVLRVAPIADEYQVKSVVKLCKSYMKDWCKRLQDDARQRPNWYEQAEYLEQMLEIVSIAGFSYEEVFTYAAPMIAKFPHALFQHFYPDAMPLGHRDRISRDKVEKCRSKFGKLSHERRDIIFTKRLAMLDQTRSFI